MRARPSGRRTLRMTKLRRSRVQAAQQNQLLALLGELAGAVEELLLAGLTTASKSTIERIDVTYKEASRMKLLRLGSTLRIVSEEISRFTTGAEQFSSRRLAFFLGRTWTLINGIRRAIEKNDDSLLARLLSMAATQPLELLKLVTLGVS